MAASASAALGTELQLANSEVLNTHPAATTLRRLAIKKLAACALFHWARGLFIIIFIL
jgi:hypothetical protein